jgi:hypothetical protein
LKKAGLLESHKEGNKIMYSINKQCPILWELRSMFFKESDIGKLLYNTFLPLSGVKVVIVTETFLKNKYLDKTDIDLLFIGDMKIREVSSAVSSVEKDLGRSIRYSVMKVEDFEFGKKKRDPILMNALTKDKIILIGKDSDLL